MVAHEHDWHIGQDRIMLERPYQLQSGRAILIEDAVDQHQVIAGRPYRVPRVVQAVGSLDLGAESLGK